MVTVTKLYFYPFLALISQTTIVVLPLLLYQNLPYTLSVVSQFEICGFI